VDVTVDPSVLDIELAQNGTYAIYDDAVTCTIQALYDLGAIVPFNWSEWDGIERYRTCRAVDAAPVAEAIRLVTAIVRADRFSSPRVRRLDGAEDRLSPAVERVLGVDDELPGAAPPPGYRTCPRVAGIVSRSERCWLAGSLAEHLQMPPKTALAWVGAEGVEPPTSAL
jgi:Family of unknown function (DUF6508)